MGTHVTLKTPTGLIATLRAQWATTLSTQSSTGLHGIALCWEVPSAPMRSEIAARRGAARTQATNVTGKTHIGQTATKHVQKASIPKTRWSTGHRGVARWWNQWRTMQMLQRPGSPISQWMPGLALVFARRLSTEHSVWQVLVGVAKTRTPAPISASRVPPLMG